MKFLLFADARGKVRRANKILLTAFVFFVFLGLTNTVQAQHKFTQKQFDQLNVLTRAAFFESAILQAANEEGVDPNLLWTVAYNETRFRPWLRSPKGAEGMMQFIPTTAQRFNLQNPYEPTAAIRASARYLKYLSGLFGGRVDSTLAAYNAGEGTVSAYLSGRTLRIGRKTINSAGQKTIGGVPPYAETIGYVGRGLNVYRWLVNRRVFPASAHQVVFPAVISAAVARAKLSDSELGNVANYNGKLGLRMSTNQAIRNVRTIQNASTTSPTNAPSAKRLSSTATNFEVYYDPRSGNRFLLRDDDRIKLPQAGQVIITKDIRQETTSNARSSFFAASALR